MKKLFKKLTDRAGLSSPPEEYLELALSEVEEERVVRKTWAKAFSQSKGDEGHAKALYLKLRGRELADEAEEAKAKAEAEAKVAADMEKARVEAEAARAKADGEEAKARADAAWAKAVAERKKFLQGNDSCGPRAQTGAMYQSRIENLETRLNDPPSGVNEHYLDRLKSELEYNRKQLQRLG